MNLLKTIAKSRPGQKVSFVLLGGMLLFVLLHMGQIKLAWVYIKGSYYQNIEQNFNKAVHQYQRFFSSTRMVDTIENEFFFSAYGYGIIKNYDKNPRSGGEGIETVLKKYPDNIYLNYMEKTKRVPNIQDLDSLSLLCLKDQGLNDLSYEAISFYGKRGLLNETWLSLLIHYLLWQDNQALAHKMQIYFKDQFNEPFVFKDSGDRPLPVSPRKMLLGYFQQEMEDTGKGLKTVADKLGNIDREVEMELQKKPDYVRLMEKVHHLENRVNELKKTYKMGYPKLKHAVDELEALKRKMSQQTTRTLEYVKEKFKNHQSELKNKMTLIHRNLRQLIPGDQRVSQGSEIPGDILTVMIAPEGSIPSARDLRFLNSEKDVILNQDITTRKRENGLHFFDWSEEEKYSRGSYTGGVDGLNYRLICFYSQQTESKYPSCAGLWLDHIVPLNQGLYVVEFVYKTVFDSCEPAFSLWYGGGEKKLPHTDNQWAKVLVIYVKNNSSPLKRIRPWFRIYQPGMCLIGGFKISFFYQTGALDLEELVIVSEASTDNGPGTQKWEADI